MFSCCFTPNKSQNCCCNLRQLTILILILLQFGHKDCTLDGSKNEELVDNGVLFIITIFYLCKGNCCK
ncbi:MAG: hypothetical protein PHX70_03010 [Clostridium sp.]|nr:hypothetical protein [Clostridium sp.]